MNSKKIIYVITKSNWGGAQRYVFDLASTVAQNHSVTVALGGTGLRGADTGLLFDKLENLKIRTILVRNFMRDVSLGKEFLTARELWKIFRKEKPDVVHLNSSKAGGEGAIAARLAGVKNIIFTVHGWPFLENRSLPAKIIIWIASWFTALLCTKIICISDYDLRIAKHMPFIRGKALRIYNGISPMNFGSGKIIRDAFPEGAKIIGTIGELNKNKNQQALIEQARNNPEMCVAIVGSGENREMLDANVKKYNLENRVKLFGFIPASEVLKGFDIFALPSLKEGSPYVLLEAKLAGLPILANRVGGIPEILDTDIKEFSLEKMVEKTTAVYQS